MLLILELSTLSSIYLRYLPLVDVKTTSLKLSLIQAIYLIKMFLNVYSKWLRGMNNKFCLMHSATTSAPSLFKWMSRCLKYFLLRIIMQCLPGYINFLFRLQKPTLVGNWCLHCSIFLFQVSNGPLLIGFDSGEGMMLTKTRKHCGVFLTWAINFRQQASIFPFLMSSSPF